MNKKIAKKKGNELEKEIAKIARKNKFKVIKNSYIGFKSKGKQKYTEVDIILINEKGIIVIESKNYNAIIKGNIEEKFIKAFYENDKEYLMFNPIIQNETHIWAIKNFLNLSDKIEIKNLIVTSNETKFELDKQVENIIKIDNLDEYLKNINQQENILTEFKNDSYYNKLMKRTKVSKILKNRHINQVNGKKKSSTKTSIKNKK